MEAGGIAAISSEWNDGFLSAYRTDWIGGVGFFTMRAFRRGLFILIVFFSHLKVTRKLIFILHLDRWHRECEKTCTLRLEQGKDEEDLEGLPIATIAS